MIRIKVSVMLIILMVSLLLGVQAAVDEHTIAVWFFNEGAGDRVSDSSGNGHDGVFDGDPKWVNAKHGSGLQFPGDASGYVVVDSSPLFEVQELTIEVLVKVEEHTGKWQGIFAKQQAGCTNRNYGIWVHNTQEVFHAQIGADGGCQYEINGTSVITDNEWHYLAFTYDGEMGRLYVDAVLETETPYSTPPFFSDDPITIGVPNLDNVNGLKGIIDEARISDVARTEEELKEAMEVGLEALLSVTHSGKLATTWAALKR
ncbi:LamG domain-containing protein [Candidatus Poribacteria bacterium]